MALPFDEGKAFLRVPPKYAHDGFGHDGSDGCTRKLPHTGIDVNTVKWRDTTVRIRSVWGGTVVAAGFDKEAGWYVIVHELDGAFWIYGHHTENLVRVGDRVAEGGVLGRIGMSGQSTGVHCHIARAKTLAAALASINGITPTKRGRTTQQWADSLGLTDPLPHIYKSLEPREQPTPVRLEDSMKIMHSPGRGYAAVSDRGFDAIGSKEEGEALGVVFGIARINDREFDLTRSAVMRGSAAFVAKVAASVGGDKAAADTVGAEVEAAVRKALAGLSVTATIGG